MPKISVYITSIILITLLNLSTTVLAEEVSSFEFCELSNITCPIFDKDDPDFEDLISNFTYYMLKASFGDPTIITAIPMKLSRGSITDILFTAQNTHFNTSSDVTIGNDVTATNETVLSANEIIANVNIPAQAATDIFYPVEIKTILLDGQEEIASGDAFMVVAASGNPEIVGITPITISKGSINTKVLIYGLNTNFTDNSIIDFHDAEIIVINQEIHSPTFMTAVITVNENANKGIHNITVTTDGEVANNTQLGILRITDNPPKLPGIIQLTQTSYEINETIGTYSFSVERLNGSDGEVSVNYIIDTAEIGFESENNTLTWLDGESGKKTFTVEIKDNSDYESDKIFSIKLVNVSSGATLGTDTATVTIINDDLPIHGIIQLTANSYEINENTATYYFNAARLNGSNGEISVDYTTIDNSAKAGQDFESKADTIIWLDGENTEKNFSIAIIDDSDYEGDETFTIKLDNALGGAGLGDNITVKIIDNDKPTAKPSHTQEPTQAIIQFTTDNYEPNSKIVIVERIGDSSGQVTVKYSLIDNYAEEDFTTINGTLIWEDGDSEEIPILIDENVEGTFTLKLTEVTGNANLGLSEIAILNDYIEDNPDDISSEGDVLTDADLEDETLTGTSSGDDALTDVDSEAETPIDTDSEDDALINADLEEEAPTDTDLEDETPTDTSSEDDALTDADLEDDALNGADLEEDTNVELSEESIISYPQSCPVDRNEINFTCSFHRNKLIQDIIIGEKASVSGGILTGIMENHGRVSVNIAKSGLLIGGVVSGYVKNQGTISNFEFRGASIKGGTLGGNIFNNSPINGHFEDVYLEANTHIIGGELRGDIIGDSEQKAILQDLVIIGRGILQNVKIAEGVEIADTVKVDESVEFIY